MVLLYIYVHSVNILYKSYLGFTHISPYKIVYLFLTLWRRLWDICFTQGSTYLTSITGLSKSFSETGTQLFGVSVKF